MSFNTATVFIEGHFLIIPVINNGLKICHFSKAIKSYKENCQLGIPFDRGKKRKGG